MVYTRGQQKVEDASLEAALALSNAITPQPPADPFLDSKDSPKKGQHLPSLVKPQVLSKASKPLGVVKAISSKTSRKARVLTPVRPPVQLSSTKTQFHTASTASVEKSRKQATRSSLLVKLPMKYFKLAPGQLREKFGINRKSAKKYNGNLNGFYLGHNPYSHFNPSMVLPSRAETRRIYDMLVKHNRKFGFGSFVRQPGHAAPQDLCVTLDGLIRVAFSQTTGNEIAIDGYSRLCNRYIYKVGGKQYAGKIPNWHSVRLCPLEDFEAALLPLGNNKKRARNIKSIIDTVYNMNETLWRRGMARYEHSGNPPNAKDFVPGMLSMQFITEAFPDKSDQAVLDRLIGLPGIGPKSAMCILAFQLKRPVFVVDVHVLRFCKWLGWLQKWATPNDAMMYLHTCIPEDIRFDFHNQIWTHCANENVREARGRQMVCPFCGSRPPARGRYADVKCPLDPYLVPLAERWGKGYVEESMEDSIKQEVDEFDTQPTTQLATTKKQQNMASFFAAQKTDPTTPDTAHSRAPSASQVSDSGYATQSTIDMSPTKRLPRTPKTPQPRKLKLRRTMLLEELTLDQAEENGYLLFEFQPLDNSFGQDWGTFDELPRFKWERPDIMLPGVAVTVEYARAVLAGEVRHRWSSVTDDEKTAMEAGSVMGAMAAE